MMGINKQKDHAVQVVAMHRHLKNRYYVYDPNIQREGNSVKYLWDTDSRDYVQCDATEWLRDSSSVSENLHEVALQLYTAWCNKSGATRFAQEKKSKQLDDVEHKQRQLERDRITAAQAAEKAERHERSLELSRLEQAAAIAAKLQRVIYPTGLSEDDIPEVLKRVVDIFSNGLTEDWEIYVCPHLNGLRPDLVLLNPNVGIGVFAVRDWTLEKERWGIDAKGVYPRIVQLTNDGFKPLEEPDPYAQVAWCKHEIQRLYCPNFPIDQKAGAIITTGLIFPNADSVQVQEFFQYVLSNRLYGNARDHVQNSF